MGHFLGIRSVLRQLDEAENWDEPSFQAAADAAMLSRKTETSRHRKVFSPSIIVLRRVGLYGERKAIAQ